MGMAASYSDEHKRQLARLVDSIRSLMNSSVALTAPLETLTELADKAEQLSAGAAQYAGERPFERYGPPVDGDLNTILPWSVVSGRYNPLAAPVAMTEEDGKLVGKVRFGLACEGPPDGVHGAVVASVYDEVLAFAAMIRGTPGHTAYLTIKYKSLTPLNADLRFESWLDRKDGRKIYASGCCYANGEIVSEAEAMFIEFRKEQPARL